MWRCASQVRYVRIRGLWYLEMETFRGIRRAILLQKREERELGDCRLEWGIYFKSPLHISHLALVLYLCYARRASSVPRQPSHLYMVLK